MSRLSMNISSSLSPYPHLDPIHIEGSQSACLAQAEREIKTLKEENLKLKKDLAEISLAYNQLTTEAEHESFDERRVNFLKAQIIQLERQIIILNEALSSRAGILLDVENFITAISDLCRNYAGSKERLGEVSMSKDDLNRIIETAESIRMKLYRNIENTSSERVACPVAMLERFLKQRSHKPVTLMDLCSGSLDHLNLKHVAKLESRLSQLYKQLTLLNQSLHSIVTNTCYTSVETGSNSLLANPDLPCSLYARLGTQTTRACVLLKDATEELLFLSVLVPAAPWPALKKPLLEEMTVANVMSHITGLSRGKTAEVKTIIESLLKAMNYNQHMTAAETKILKDEVIFHQTIYQQQMEYVASMWQALRIGYSDFQNNTNTFICQPMQEVLDSYSKLQTAASEDALKCFLKVFKDHHSKINSAMEKLKNHLHDNQGQEAISAYEEDFFTSLNSLQQKQKEIRDTNLAEHEIVKQQLEDFSNEISNMLRKQEIVHKPELTCSLTEGVTQLNINDSGDSSPEKIEKTPRKSRKSKSPDSSRKPGDASKSCISESNLTAKTQMRNIVNEAQVECLHNDDEDKQLRQPKKGSIAKQNRKPPKSIKGIAQSQLTLQGKGKPKIYSSETDAPDFDNSLSHRSESLSDISLHRIEKSIVADRPPSRNGIDEPLYQHRIDDSFASDRPPSQNRIVRSGSMSHINQRASKPAHLEPLISPLVHSRHSTGKQNSSGPWR